LDIESIVAKVTEQVYSRLAAAEKAEKEKEKTAPTLSGADLAGTLEHSLLNPDTSASVILKGCEDAKKYGFANVCVSPYYVSMA
jgi:hypothetical protein